MGRTVSISNVPVVRWHRSPSCVILGLPLREMMLKSCVAGSRYRCCNVSELTAARNKRRDSG